MLYCSSLTIATAHGQFARLLGGAFGVNLAAVIFKFYSNSSLKDLTQEVHMEVSIKNIELLKLMPETMKRKIQILCLEALNKIYLMGMYNVFICLFKCLYVLLYSRYRSRCNILGNVVYQKVQCFQQIE